MAWGMRNVRICLFGSSIMEGRIGVEDPMERWYNVMLTRLSRTVPTTCFSIINSAVGGESTREIMARFERDVLAYDADLCLFMVGGNNHDCANPHRILAEGELAALVSDFTARLPARTRPVGVVINPAVDAWHSSTRNPVFQEYLSLYGGSLDACLNQERDFARTFYERQGWPCLDLYALMSATPEAYVVQDGIHLNPAGHRLFGEKMAELTRGLL